VKKLMGGLSSYLWARNSLVTRLYGIMIVRTLVLYTGPISNRVGFSIQTCFLSSSAELNELYRKYTSPGKVNANSRWVKSFAGVCSWFSQL